MLREVTFGRRIMGKVGSQTWEEVYACHFIIDVEGWRLSLYNDCDALDYCEEALSPEPSLEAEKEQAQRKQLKNSQVIPVIRSNRGGIYLHSKVSVTS